MLGLGLQMLRRRADNPPCQWRCASAAARSLFPLNMQQAPPLRFRAPSARFPPSAAGFKPPRSILHTILLIWGMYRNYTSLRRPPARPAAVSCSISSPALHFPLLQAAVLYAQ